MIPKTLLILFFAAAVWSFPALAEIPKGATEIGDYNSDGIEDYLLIDAETARSKNESYFVFLSDKATGQHKRLEITVSHPYWDDKTKTLTSHSFGGGGRTYFHETYESHGNSPKLIMTVQRTEKEVKGDPGNLEFTVTTRRMIAGKWVETVTKE
jgi:hypothetical protein